MKILITGACGFIGRELISELESEHTLRLLDAARPEEATVFVGGQAGRAARPLVTDWPFVTADITNPEAVARAREYFKPYQPSSPQIALLKDGKLVHMMQRHDIEGRDPQTIAQSLAKVFDEHCKKA